MGAVRSVAANTDTVTAGTRRAEIAPVVSTQDERVTAGVSEVLR